MKQFALLLITIVFATVTLGQSNSLQEGNSCFSKGNYTCAIEKYKEATKSPDERQQKIAGDNLRQAEKCLEFRRVGDAAFDRKNFIEAKEYYDSVLTENPKDEYVKVRLNEIKIALITLSVSKNALLFSSSGGQETMAVITEADSYSVELLPPWCTVQKNGKYFVITCTENTLQTDRTDIFTVSAGNKTEKINIRQSGKLDISLSVSKENISFTSDTGNSGPILVYTNAANFSISLVPSWCSVQTYNGYFTISCNSNISTQSRSSWFKITAGNKEIIIHVTQAGNLNSIVSKPVSQRVDAQKRSTRVRTPLSPFISLGIQSGEIARYGLLFESGGNRFMGLRVVARSSMTAEDEVLNETGLPNKMEMEIGPNFKISKWVYLNLGVGYGYYKTNITNEYAGTRIVENVGYVVTSAGVMVRLNRLINISGGVSFMNLYEAVYRPEITAGISFNLRKASK